MHCPLAVFRLLCILSCILILTTSFDRKFTEATTHPRAKATISRDGYLKKNAPDPLYVLEISAQDFAAKETDKWVFKFVRIREKTMTLHGWYAKGWFGRTFKPEHKIELIPTKTESLPYSSDMYFGDIILSRRDVREIKKLIRQGKVDVIRFTPRYNPAPHLAYVVTLISQSDSLETKLADTFQANPSPPKGFNNKVNDD